MGKSKDVCREYGASGQFLKMEDGDSLEVVFLSAEKIKNSFDKTKDSMRYHLRVEGEEKWLDSGSRSLSRQMAKIEENDAIVIKRSGKFTDTTYTVDKAT